MKNKDIPSMTIETKKQTIVEMDIPAKPCTPVMEILIFLTEQSAGSQTKSCLIYSKMTVELFKSFMV